MPEPTKRRRGRPTMESGHKSTTIQARFSAEDRQRIEDAANTEGKRVSDWVRDTLLKAIANREEQV